MLHESPIFPAGVRHATVILAALVLTGITLLGAPARTSIGPDTEEPPDDLVCELGTDLSAESVDPTRWVGRFGGIGIQIGFNNDAVTVDEMMKDGPAEKAGVCKGDQIVQINDETTAGLNVNDVVRRLRGEPGSALKLTVVRPATGKTRECRLQRGLVKVESVRDAQLLAGKVAYVRLASFNRYTGSDLRAALAPLERAGARGWVLDLRHNRGGLLRAVRDVASQFLEPAQSVLVLRPAQAEAQQQFFASRYGPRLGGPLCVLVNLNTGGAAEALAGALRWHRHAVLVGAKTCGHNEVVRLVAAPDGKVSLTLHGDIIPLDGKETAGQRGLAPDIEVVATSSEDTAVWQRVLPGRRDAADLSNNRVIQRAVAICLGQLGRPSQ